MRIWAPVTLACSGVLGLFLGCSGDGGQNCTVGTQFCLCFQGTCQVGLVCVNNYCLSPNDAETSGNPGDGDGDGDGDSGDGDGDSGDGDGDGMSGDGDGGPGDGDGTPGDGDGDGTPGDGDGDPGQDSDNDGIPNAQDNCPLDPNPRQLDFDGNGQGNVCDILTFTNVSGTLSTTLVAVTDFGSCNLPTSWQVLGGLVQVELDDDATLARWEITELELADINELCEIFFDVDVEMSDPTVSLMGNPFPVSMAHGMTAHNNGTITGTSNAGHPVVLTSDITVTVDGLPNGPALSMATGTLPSFAASVSGGGSNGTLTWSVVNMAVINQTAISIMVPLELQASYRFTGLSGSLQLSP